MVMVLRRQDVVVSDADLMSASHTGTDDALVLEAAAEDGLTLVTYALKTIPPLLVEWGASGRSHGGVIFVDERTISPADFRGLARSLRVCWETRGGWDWNERIIYLKPA
jgi:hypothetical protein